MQKRMIPGWVRAEIARQYGCSPGETITTWCAYCEALGTLRWWRREGSRVGWVSLLDLEWDHIVPEARGGPSTPDNLALACRDCNRRKGSKNVDEFLAAT